MNFQVKDELKDEEVSKIAKGRYIGDLEKSWIKSKEKAWKPLESCDHDAFIVDAMEKYNGNDTSHCGHNDMHAKNTFSRFKHHDHNKANNGRDETQAKHIFACLNRKRRYFWEGFDFDMRKWQQVIIKHEFGEIWSHWRHISLLIFMYSSYPFMVFHSLIMSS